MMNTASTVSSLLELLRGRAAERAGDLAYLFLQDGEQEAERLTYGELDRQARAIAARLEERGAQGERVLLLFTPGLEFVASFFGCLYAGAVAVPSYPPRPGRAQPRLASIAQDAQPRFALASAAIAAKAAILENDIPALAGVEWIVPEEIPAGLADTWCEPAVGPGTLAFLQYTSGSTSDPKGVMVSHGNLIDNQRVIQETCRHTAESTFVSWLPMFHDMGLIGCVLQPLYLGALGVLMAPSAFLQRPVRWLQAISTYRAHTSGAPNFAYELCVRKIPVEERALLDLSGWQVAFNGAEPVRASTLEEFAVEFAVAGFRRTAFLPCYGLAEATLMVSGASRREPRVEPFQGLDQGLATPAGEGEGGRALVSCGPVDPRQTVVIADPVSLAEQPPGSVGEIWVSGPSVAQGYWERPEESTRTFGARLAGEADRTFLRTGDLGFLDRGELFVTGRVKDLIIVRGRNHYPQDVEATAESSHAALRPGCSAAFAVDDGGEERLVVVTEMERRSQVPPDEVVEAVRRAVEAEHEVEVHEVVLTRSDSVPKTSSGKVQRSLCRTLYLAGELPVLGKSAARAPLPESAGAPDRQVLLAASPSERRALVEAYLRRQTGLSESDDRPLAGLGMDSLRILELTGRVERDLGVSLPLPDLFEAPGLGALAERILAEWEEDRPVAVPLVAEGPTEGDHPLSHGQRALWFLDRLAPESPVYNLAVAGVWRRIERGIEPRRLAAALRNLVDRHPSLRTTFVVVDGEPVQRVHPALEPEILIEDASQWDADRLESRMADFAWRPFDLARGPLLRAALFERPDGRLEGETAVVLAAHHIVVDLWSFSILLRELVALVRQTPLPPLALRYTDFARWQRLRLEGEEGERLWAYWRERLSGELPALDLPADRPRPPVQTYRGAAEPAEWSGELALAVRDLAHARGATLYMALLSGFFALLHRLSGQDDLIVGSPTAGRRTDGLAGLVGYFVQPLALRADLGADPSFEGLLAQVRRTVVEAFEHQDFPVPLLAERLQPVRDPGRSPLFQVLFALQSTLGDGAGISAFGLGARGVRVQVGEVEIETLPIEERRAPFDLTLTLAERIDGRLAALLQWNRDLFDPETARRMLGHLRTLMESAAADPGRPVSSLPLLTGAERQQVLRGWNETAAEIPEPALVHELFAAEAARAPEAVAVDFEGTSRTYRELADRASQLARHLQRMGVVPETRVGVLLHRSDDLLATLLGVLEAGGAYVPLDPAYPRERLELMLRDSGAPVVVTESRLADLVSGDGVQTFCLDTEAPVPALDSAAPLSSGRSHPDSLAYVIYTSGSTGRPKGVQVSHRALVNLLAHMRRELTVTPADVLLAVTTLSFDIAALELFLPLISGARVALARRETAIDGDRLAREIERSGATLMQATPATWRLLLEAGWQGSPRLTALCGGEALPRELADRLLVRTGRLWNVYGPTETTVWSSTHRVEPGEGVVPLGRPIANTAIHLLDRHLEPVPPGVAGALYIGGEGLARGYLDRPELTAAAFVPDPWSSAPGRRLYRTGDLARFRPGGGIEFLGRGDTQVKVRGFRIELGEIEAALARHPDVSQAVAVVREDQPGDRRLVAYVVPGPAAPDPAGLRVHLRATLPEHAVPASFVLLPALPKTPNGKIDRRALPAPDDGESHGARKPQGPVEEVLAGLWSEALGRGGVGADESFFDLGGHSLLAARLLARVKEVFQADLPLSVLFEAPTVEGLAARIETARGQAPAPALRSVPRGAELPLSPAQLRLWFLWHLAPDSAAYNIPLAVRLEGPLDREALAASCAEVVRRHEALRTTFHRNGEEPLQRVSPSVPLSVPDLSVPSSVSVELPFDLATGPPVRFALQRLAEQTHLLIVTVHHIVCDGASLEVLVREIAALYGGAALPAPPLQLGDFVLWQRQWIAEGGIAPGLAYWRGQLASMPPVLDLPADRPRPPAQSFAGGIVPLRPAFALDKVLDRLSQRRGVTRFMTLLAGFAALLERSTGQADFAIGSPFVDSRAVLGGAVGLFINTVVLRARIDGELPFAALLERVREACLGAYEHQDVPFERLVEEVQGERDMSRNPLFQVMLAWERVPEPAQAAGLTFRPRPLHTATAKVDLTLYLLEGEEGIEAALEFSTALFDAPTVQRLGERLLALLEGAAADPERPLVELPLLLPGERAQLVREWNDTAVERPGEVCLHELIERQAERTPDAPAVVFEERSLSYRELMQRAGELAAHLAGLGVGPESVVAIRAERSLELMVGLLGILKAGAAYLPLDSEYPQERLAFMQADAGAAVLLTRERLAGEWQGTRATPRRAQPDNPAYVIYTSGSTGRPKGVAVSHRGICNRLLWMQEAYGLTPADRVLQKTPIGFDVSVWELFWPLLTGACLVLARPGGHRDSTYLARLIHDERITTLHFVPSMLAAFLAEDDLSGCGSLVRVICSGEALPPELEHRFFQRLGAELHNLYGPTEASVDVTAWRCSPADEPRPVPIGRPIAGIRAHVLDAGMRLVPLGATGELWLGGVGLARGYLHRPDVTADRFRPDPLSPVLKETPGERLYRTGDLARHRPDGAIEYLGRVDHQVKIRGFRIELGEIEAALAQHPSVHEAVTVVREDAPGDRRLAAYVTARAGMQIATGELRVFLQERLPEPMVPADFVVLDELPLSVNGKVDRKALPAPDRSGAASRQGFVAPRNPTEEVLAAIWSQVLGVDPIGVRDNFFELGGDSIRSIRVRSLVRSRGLDVTLQQIFAHRTIADLAREVRRAEDPVDPANPANPAETAGVQAEPFDLVPAGERARLPEGLADAFPLAMLQEGLVFHSEMSADYEVYVTSFRLRARFSAEALRGAAARLAERHPMLRTSFDLTRFSEPLQLVHREAGLPLVTEDLRALTPEAREERLAAWAEIERRRKFDWETAPFARLHVHRLDDETFHCALVHSIFDGWSMALMTTELFRTYVALLCGEEPPSEPPPAVTYREYVVLERATRAAREAQAFWRERLAGATQTRLPRWGRKPADAAAALHVRRTFAVPEETLRGLQAMARSLAVPLKSTLLAAHLRVVEAIAGHTDVVAGLLANGRPEETDGDRVLGLFLNAVPFRLDLAGGTWEELVQQTFEAERALLPFRRFPLAELQREYGAGGGGAAFETVFNFTHFHAFEVLRALDGLEVLDASAPSDQTYFPLTVYFNLDLPARHLHFSVDWDTRELCEEQVDRIVGYHLGALAAAAREPRARYDAASLLAPEEQRQVLAAWNDTDAELPEDLLVHELVEAQVVQTPQAPAVLGHGTVWTYAELDARAGRLARRLRGLGVGPEVRVGICLRRSPALPAAVLGVLKAGGAYVPLDPTYPRERLTYMLEDAQARVLVTEEDLVDLLPAPGLAVVCLDRDEPAEVSGGPDLPPATLPENAAYVIYTSGSTGRPKGVIVPHRGVVNFLLSMAREPGLGPADLLAAVTSLSFDIAVLELLLPLTVGARVLVVDSVTAADGERLLRLLDREAPTVMQATPATWRLLLEAGWTESPGLRALCGGEALPRELAEDLLARTAGLTNLYGPTETTIWSSVHRVEPGRPAVPLGRPIANTRIHLLDAHGLPTPLGTDGEIHLGGTGVVRGYAGRPDLTAERFVPDPFGEPGARLYRTGDLARRSADGDLEFLGRLDHQVKVRGFRIELGEIESVLAEHPAVREAVVAARRDLPGEPRLVAYVVAATNGNSGNSLGADLRAFLRQRLPEHMVPSAFVTLDAFPLTANRKLDRRALPAPAEAAAEAHRAVLPPRDALELELVRLWAEVLGMPSAGVTDDFFELGGHSLLAMRLMARLRQRFARALPVSILFQARTVERMAALLRREPGSESPALVEIQPAGSRAPFFCVHPVGGNVLCYADLARALGTDQPFFGLQAPELAGGERLAGIEDRAARYVQAVRAVQPAGPYRLGGWSMGAVIAFEMAQQLVRAGETVELLALVDGSRPNGSAAHPNEEAALAAWFARDLAGRAGIASHVPTGTGLGDLLEWARAARILPEDSGAADIEELYELFKANLAALRRYVPRPYPGRLLVVRAAEPPQADGRDAALGWDGLALRGLDLHELPGDHYALLRAPHVDRLAELLATHLGPEETPLPTRIELQETLDNALDVL